MSRKSIKRILRDRIKAHLIEQDAGAELSDIQIVTAFAGSVLREKHIRIGTPTASPQIAGESNLGRWNVTVMITVVSQSDDQTEDVHDDLVGIVEAYVLQGNKALATLLTDSTIAVENVMPGDSSELEIESLRYSGQELLCECYIK